MTAPSNFPGRINARRRGALSRIEAQLASGVKANSGHLTALTAGDTARLSQQADTLALRIVSDEAARAIHTKKTPKETWSADRRAVRSGRI